MAAVPDLTAGESSVSAEPSAEPPAPETSRPAHPWGDWFCSPQLHCFLPPLIFAFGSENPVKIDCVTEAVAEFWPGARASGTRADSGVSAQPSSDHEMFSGALNRARQALANIPTASFGVGIEGGTRDADGEMWAYACVVIVDRIGNVGKGQTGRFVLPTPIAQMVREGVELGEADDRFFGRNNSKQQE